MVSGANTSSPIVRLADFGNCEQNPVQIVVISLLCANDLQWFRRAHRWASEVKASLSVLLKFGWAQTLAPSVMCGLLVSVYVKVLDPDKSPRHS